MRSGGVYHRDFDLFRAAAALEEAVPPGGLGDLRHADRGGPDRLRAEPWQQELGSVQYQKDGRCAGLSAGCPLEIRQLSLVG